MRSETHPAASWPTPQTAGYAAATAKRQAHRLEELALGDSADFELRRLARIDQAEGRKIGCQVGEHASNARIVINGGRAASKRITQGVNRGAEVDRRGEALEESALEEVELACRLAHATVEDPPELGA